MGGDDPRPLFRRALDQTERQVRAVRTSELDNSTPCAEYDVRALLGHLVAVLHKLLRVAEGTNPSDVPAVLDGVADEDWSEVFSKARSEVEQAWAADVLLDELVTLPWATLPGRVALDAYTHEFTAHSWDLAQATGRSDRLDPELAWRALDAFATFAPPDDRSEQGPFGPVLSAPDDGDVYHRLAAYLGRLPLKPLELG